MKGFSFSIKRLYTKMVVQVLSQLPFYFLQAIPNSQMTPYFIHIQEEQAAGKEGSILIGVRTGGKR